MVLTIRDSEMANSYKSCTRLLNIAGNACISPNIDDSPMDYVIANECRLNLYDLSNFGSISTCPQFVSFEIHLEIIMVIADRCSKRIMCITERLC